MPIELLQHALVGFDADDKAPFEWALHPSSVSLYRAARTELMGSSVARQVFEYLENQGREIVIFVSTSPAALPNFYPSEEMQRHKVGHLRDRSVVIWNPELRLEVSDRKASYEALAKQRSLVKAVPKRVVTKAFSKGYQSAAMGLIHEVGHARQYCLKNDWFMAKFLQFRDQRLEQAKLDIENDNLTSVEIPVATQLGQPIRWSYKDF
jgi:hypothetical protein